MRIVQSWVAGGPWVCLPERRHFWDVVLTQQTQGDCKVHDVKATCIPRYTWCLLTTVLCVLEGSDMYLPGINMWASSRDMSKISVGLDLFLTVHLISILLSLD